MAYGYDDAGRRASITYPGGTNQVTYGYDNANRLTSVTDWNSNATSYAYDDAGRMTTTTLPTGTGLVSTYAYDDADRLTGISHVKDGATTLASVAYTLDGVGNRTQRVDQQGTHTYAYDDLHRLTSVTYPGPSTTSYAFDAFGNRTSMTVAGNTTTYAYDDNDRVTSVTPPSPAPSVGYTWDDNGDLTERGSDSFSWDHEDRLVSATVNGVTSSFAYRGDGLCDSRSVGATTTTFTWDIAGGLPVVLDDGNQYVYGAGLTAMKQSGSWHYYLADGLGSTMAIVDSSGNSQKSYQYDVYGEVTGGAGSLSNEFDFAGQQTDPTGLQYLRARYYDPATGTFLSRDPLAADPTWAGSPFGYSYADPVALSDPAGLDSPWADWKKNVNPCNLGSLTGAACDKAGEVINAVVGVAGPVVGPLVIVGEYLRVVGDGISDWMRAHPDEMNFIIGTAFTLGFGACLATAVVSAGGTSPGCVAIAAGWGAWSAATALDHLESSNGDRSEKSIRLAVDVINSLPMGKARTIMMNLLSTLVNPQAVR